MLAYTGMRIGEALSLEVRHVDVKARRILVEQTWTDAYGTLILGTPKGGKSRKVPIDGWLIEELLPLLTGAPDSWVFSPPRGGHLHPNNWRNRVWSVARRGTEFEAIGLTPHDLRHTAASMAIAAGADVKVVQTMLGHASAVETLDRYGHLWPDRLDEVTALVGIARATALASA